MVTNWPVSYPSSFFGYPLLWVNWQKSTFKNWFDLWGKATPTKINGIEQIINIQEQWIKAFLEIEEKSIQKTLETQKLFWDNYFEVLGNNNGKNPESALKKTVENMFPTPANLEEFPTAAGVSLEAFPSSAKLPG